MTTLKLNRGGLFPALLTLLSAIALFEFGGLAEPGGTLLPTLAFWTALLQGSVAAVATADLTHARWSGSLRRELLAPYPLLLLITVLFLLLWPRLDLYPWVREPDLWLNKPFFLLRNVLLLAAVLAAAHLFVRRSLAGATSRGRIAVVYLLLFVACQSLVAFDWVMSLEYPWVSTLLGAYFFVESLYAGLALAGVLLFLLYRPKAGRAPRTTREHLRDVGTLIFGFSILWGGLFFAQFLLIWYGNIPEEVDYVVRRISASPFREMSVLFLAGNFLVPFLVLLSRRAKERPAVVGVVAAVVLAGLFLERLLFILPVAPMHLGILLAENLLLLFAFLLIVHSSDRLLPAGEEQEED